MLRPRRFVCIAAVALVAVACGSVPEVSYGNADSGADASRDGSPPPPPSDAGGDAATDAGNDAGDPTRCPDKQPTGGICCGATPCIGCQSSDCTSCAAKGCNGSQVCCPAGMNNVVCRNPQDC